MIAFGIHFGYFTIRVSKCFKRRGRDKLQFRQVTRPDYGAVDWWPNYQGAFPNIFDPDTETVGYEALKQVGELNLQRMCRFDTQFFKQLLDTEQENHPNITIWKRFLSTLRQDYIRDTDQPRIGLHLEGVFLAKKKSSWMPWLFEKDRSFKLVERLRTLGRYLDFEDITLVRERQLIERYVARQSNLSVGELLLTIGGERSSVWLVVDSNSGKVQSLQTCPGIDNLVAHINNKKSPDVLMALISCLNQGNCKDVTQLEPALEDWRKNGLRPALYQARKVTENASFGEKTSRQDPRVIGEGAHLLIRVKQKKSLAPESHYWQANTAAEIVLTKDGQEGRK